METLILAVQSNDDNLSELQALIHVATPREKDVTLAHAVKCGKEAMVQLLLENGAYENAYMILNIQDGLLEDRSPGYRERHRRFRNQPYERLREFDRTPDYAPRIRRVLHIAYEDRHIGIVRLLMKARARITIPMSVRDEDGYVSRHEYTTVAEKALLTDDVEMIDALLVGYTSTTSAGERAVFQKLLDLKDRIILLDPPHVYVTANDDIDGLARRLEDAATIPQVDKALAYAVHHNRTDMVQMLLERGAYPDNGRLGSPEMENNSLRRIDYTTPKPRKVLQIKRVLHVAYENGNFDIVGLLLDHGANLQLWYSESFPYGRTLVDHAIVANDYNTLFFFKEHGWNVNERNHHGHTPLMIACEANNNDMIAYLTEWGANVDIGTPTNIEICIRNGNRQGVRLLMQKNVDITIGYPLELAIQEYEGHLRRLHPLVDDLDLNSIPHIDPDDPDDRNDGGDEVKTRRGIIREILDYSVDFDFTIFDPTVVKTRENEIRYVTMKYYADAIKNLVNDYRHRQTVEFLATLDSNAVNSQDKYKRTALHRAVKNGQLEAVRYLIHTKNAKLDLLDLWGKTASQSLEANYSDKILKLSNPENFFVPWRGHRGVWRSYTELVWKKLFIYKSIGRYISERRLFLARLGPGMTTPSDVVRRFADYLFS
jgi:ankyrin repeat protein